MNQADLETTYELIATHIDQFDEAVAPVYLAKLALLLSTKINDLDVVRECIESAAKELAKKSNKR